YHDEPLPIADRQAQVDTFVAEYFPNKSRQQKPRHQSNGHAASGFVDWGALRAELGRRIEAHESARRNGSGKVDCRGLCDDGEGNSGLFYDPPTNQAHCNAGCDQATILRAFGLPDAPDSTRTYKQNGHAGRRSETKPDGPEGRGPSTTGESAVVVAHHHVLDSILE